MRISSPTIIQIILLCVTISVTGCAQSSQEETVITTTIYDGCCGTAPKVYEVEDYKVYIPNVITPNGDGINDAFYPICNKMEKGKFAVANYQIFNDTGKVIFVRDGLDILDPESWSFKGVGLLRPYKPKNHEQFDYTGKFTYTFILAFKKADNTEELIKVSGEACVVRCDQDAHVLIGKDGCYFPLQGVGGIYNPNIANNEENCIK